MMIIPYRNLKIFLFKIITQKVKDFIPLLNYFYGHKNKTSFSDFNEDNTENIVNVPSNLRIGFYKISVRYKGSKPSNPSIMNFKPPYLSPRNNINPRTLRNNQGANNQNRTSGDHQPINNTNTATRYPVNSNNNSSKFKSIRDEYENLPNQAANTNTEKNPINNKLDYLKQDSNNNNDLATLIAKKTITNTTSSFVFPKTTTPPLLLPPPAPIQPLLIATTPTPIEEVVTTQEPPNIPETIVLVTITPEFPVSIIQEVSNTNIPVPPPLPAKLLSPNQSTIVSGHIEIKNAVATFNENNNNVNDTILIEKRKQEIQLLEKKQEEIRKESLKELFKASQLEKKKYLILEQKHWTEDKVNFLKEINDFLNNFYNKFSKDFTEITRDTMEFNSLSKLYESCKDQKTLDLLAKFIADPIIDPRTIVQLQTEITRYTQLTFILENHSRSLPEPLFHELIRRLGTIINNDAIYIDDFRNSIIMKEGEGSTLHKNAYKIISNNKNRFYTENPIKLNSKEFNNIINKITKGEFYVGKFIQNREILQGKFLDFGDEIHMHIMINLILNNGNTMFLSVGSFTSTQDSNTITLTKNQYIDSEDKITPKAQRFRPFTQFVNIPENDFIRCEKATAYAHNTDCENINVKAKIIQEILSKSEEFKINNIREVLYITKENITIIALENSKAIIKILQQKLNKIQQEQHAIKDEKKKKETLTLLERQHNNFLKEKKTNDFFKAMPKEIQKLNKTRNDFEEEKNKQKTKINNNK